MLVVSAAAALMIVSAAKTEDGFRFYDQLTSDQKPFYEAMVEMYESGTFKSGVDSLELTENEKYLTQEKVKSYMDGNGNMLLDYGAARDAFDADYPGVFYVDFSNLSIRVTTGGGVYHAYIGTGRTDNYFAEGFGSKADVEKAVAEYDEALKKLVAEAKEVTVEEGKSLAAEQVTFVHDKLTESVSYRLENTCKTENLGHIRTAYGALVRHEGVCEAYTRAFKAVMDELGIPCVTVSGVYMHDENTPELHIWNDVRVDGKWYGVDVTMDDPISMKKDENGNYIPTETNGLDGYENHDNLLLGSLAMGRHHSESGIMSEANYEFIYPTLEVDNYGVEVKADASGLVVKLELGTHSEDESVPAGHFYISFRGMGCKAAQSQGYYMLERYWYEGENGELLQNDWHYITPELYHNMEDTEEYLHLEYPQVEWAEYAVTETPHGPLQDHPENIMFYGDPDAFIAQSEPIYNENSGYKAPPYPKTSNPSMSGSLEITGNTYKMEIIYDDELVLAPDATEPKLSVSAIHYIGTERVANESAVKNCVAANLKIEGDKVTFDFKPSDMYMDDSTLYIFNFEGVVGKTSGKAPIEVSYVAKHRCAVCAYKSVGIDWNVFGKPALIENGDLSMTGWETSDGEPVDAMLSKRLALVVQETSPKQEHEMLDMIKEDELAEGEEIVSSQTYNINLTLCKAQVISTGQSVRISLGFPEGYGPEDEGIKFIAYHFIKDPETGETVGVEEIPCTVTRYGLIIEVKSFSPFAIVAVKSDNIEESAERTVILSGDKGGSITSSAEGSNVKLKAGETVTVTVEADKGYAIDALKLGDEVIAEASGKTDYTLTVSYDDIDATYGSSVVEVKFAVESVLAAEAKNGQTAVALPSTDIEDEPPVRGPGTLDTDADTTAPDTTDPDTSASDTTAPDTTAPDTTAPDTSAPDTTASDTTASDTTAPDTSASDTTAPDTSESDTTAPDTTASDTTAPDTTAPDTSASDTTAPDTTAPDTTEPAVTTEPGTTEPGTTEPAVTTEPGTTEPAVTDKGTEKPADTTAASADTGSESEPPVTGDGSDMWIALSMAIVSTAAIGATAFDLFRRRKNGSDR